ncbi:DUF748 domain-containing protein [Methylobacillus arboreus]|uniref:DUF748 domain-containing protein n=1 Tax=Methylobacillus arboreus TaxID=755170 RepID=UPI001E53D321|nr:DUF748 domain-containing protein [Methylobacillus arboreus]MCB5189759.1 DUF748 domain-containing protein [Methylobacillus arboreus]
MLNRAKKIISSLPFLMGLGFWVSYLLFGYFAVNPIAQKVLPWVAENKLASRLDVERVSYDPLRIAVTVDKLRLTTPEGSELAGFERLHADLELSGLFRFAWRLKDILLSAPHVTFEITPEGSSNWAALIAKLNENPKEEPSEGMVRLLIDHILIEHGDFEYVDRNRAEAFRAVLEPLDLELDGFSTLPEDLGDYAIMAKLPEQGGTLKWKGELGLNPIVSNGKVELEGVNLPKLLKALPPDALPVRLDEGVLQTRLDYHFAMVEDKPQATVSNLSLNLSALAGTLLQSQDQAGKLGLQQLQLDLPKLEYSAALETQVQFAGLTLGLSDLRLEQAGKSLLALPQLALEDASLDLQQRKLDIAGLKLAEGNLHAERARNGLVNWQQLHVAAAETENAPVEESQEPEQALPFEITLGQFNLAGFKADYEDHAFKHALKVAVDDINLNLKFASRQGEISLDDVHSEVGPFRLQSALYKDPAAVLNKLFLQNGKLELAQSRAVLDAIVLSGLDAKVLKDAKSLNWQAMLEPVSAATSKKAEASKQQQASPWVLDLKRFALENAAIHIEDRSTPQPVALDIQQAALEVKDISLDTKRALPVSLAFKVKQGGAFSGSGKLAPEPLQGDLKLKLANFSLKPFAPYINQAALLKLNDGAANTAGNLNIKSGKQLSVLYKGGFSINKLDIVEEEGGQPFLGWKSLATDNLQFGLAPDKLHIGELRIVEPNGKFIIYEDRTLNVKRILRDQGDSAAENTPATQEAKEGEGFPVAVERIRIDKASLEFADLSLTPQFGTNIHTLSGVVNGLSTSPSSTAQVELDGKVDDYGSARIRGSVQPFQATEFTDLKLAFRNLEMNRLTPYSGKFAGRRIDSGKLSVDLEYKIKERQLAGENKFIVNKLKLGEQVDSEDAVNLPLDLAIALLEDSSGVIDLDLPVSGSLDDPEFSYGKIVWKAIVNVLGKIVTSPFRALGNLLGISSDKLEALEFDPGSAELAPPEQEKLKAISEALAKRPALVLQIAPVSDEKVDGRALQEQFVRNQVAAKMGIQLQPGEKPGPVDTHNKKVRSALDKLGKEQLKPESLESINAEKDEVARYGKLLDALNQDARLEPAWLQALANARAEVVQGYLLETLALEPGKLHVNPLRQQSGSAAEVKMPLELGVDRKD